MLLEHDTSFVVSNSKVGRSVGFVQQIIPDEPTARDLALKKIVFKYCKDVLFPNVSLSVETTELHVNHVNCVASRSECDVNQKKEDENAVLENLWVENLSGGITNTLFRVSSLLDPSSSVVVRCFGKETERVVSRESELFYQSLFIPTYVQGTNFLIYKFFDQYEVLSSKDLLKESTNIAKELSLFHVKATLESMRDFNRPYLNEEEQIYWGPVEVALTNGKTTSYTVSRFHREENYTLHALQTWVEQLFSESILNKVSAEKMADYRDISKQLQRETQWMLQLLQNYASLLGECVCHNDLLSANIMRHKDNGSFLIIDFDYARRNYFLFDIANHFNEYAGLECDYAQCFPSDKDMAKFINVYRENMRKELLKRQGGVFYVQLKNIFFKQDDFLDSGLVDDSEEQKAIAHWVQLVKLLTLPSHLCWSVWALLQEAVSELDVDFLNYSKCRLARYFETKDEFSAGFI